MDYVTEQQEHNMVVSTMRMLARKGTYDVLLQIKQRGFMHYNDVLRYMLNARLIKSRACVTTILNDLTDGGLLDRTVVQTRPARTQYRISEMGLMMLKHLEEIENIVISNSIKTNRSSD